MFRANLYTDTGLVNELIGTVAEIILKEEEKILRVQLMNSHL